jgi:hypothetical protein
VNFDSAPRDPGRIGKSGAIMIPGLIAQLPHPAHESGDAAASHRSLSMRTYAQPPNPAHARGVSGLGRPNPATLATDQRRYAISLTPLPEPQVQRTCACGGACAGCRATQADHDEERLHTKRDPAGGPGESTVPPVVHEVLRAPGHPLYPAARSFMERRFGHDFGQVRVHADAQAGDSARAVQALAYTAGRHVVFGAGRYAPATAAGRRLLAHELAHAIQQGFAPDPLPRRIGEPGGALERQADATADGVMSDHARPGLGQGDRPEAGAPPATLQRAPDQEPVPPLDLHSEEETTMRSSSTAHETVPPECHSGCAQRWGQDTTCSKWGFVQGVHERGEGKNWKAYNCCNSWPWALEDYARNSLGLNGAASCHAPHQRQIATVSWGDKDVQVLCSDTIPGDKFGEREVKSKFCTGKIDKEVIELSPKAMQDLSDQTLNALGVRVCYSGTQQDLCLHNGPGPARRTGRDAFPECEDCLTAGCPVPEGTPKLKDTGWPRA